MNLVIVQQPASDDTTTVWTLEVDVGDVSQTVVIKSGQFTRQEFFCESVTVSRSGHADFTVTPTDRSLLTLCNEPFTIHIGPSGEESICFLLALFGWAFLFCRLFRV